MVTHLKLASLPLLVTLSPLLYFLQSSPSFGQNVQPIDQQDRYESHLQRISELEVTHGYSHPTLLEELTSAADSATKLNLNSDSSLLLDRAIQIQRQNYGLFAADQIPLYFDLIKSNLLTGNWQAVNKSLDYLHWLLTEKKVDDVNSLIPNLIQLSELHLYAVAGDAMQEQARHYRSAEELTLLAIRLSKDSWDQSDLRRLDLYYSMIKQLYLQSAAVDRGGDTGYELRAIVPGSSWVKPKRTIQTEYYRAGLRLFSEMREVVTQSSNNSTESLAMINLYRADWHVLFNQESAEGAYKEVFEALSLAGTNTDELNGLFSKPQILPIPILFDSVTELLAGAESSGLNTTIREPDKILQFQDWFYSMPFVPFPATSPSLLRSITTDYTEYLLQFRLNSLEKVSRWVNGTYRTRIGVVSNFEHLNNSDSQLTDLGILKQRLHLLHFRPLLENGVAQPFEGTLLYRLALE